MTRDRACRNCDAPLAGRWCHACGQDSRDPVRELRPLLEEFLDAALSWDSKLLTTLKVLVRQPGQLTLDLVAGRRARYFGPVRLYLLISVAYAAVYALFGGEPTLVYIAGGGDVVQGLEEIGRLQRWLSLILIALMPMATLAMAALFHRDGIPFVRHLAFVLHLSAMALLVWAAARPVAYAAGELVGFVGELGVAFLINVGLALHCFRAAKAHYGRGDLDTFWRLMVYGFVSAAMVRATVLVALRIADAG